MTFKVLNSVDITEMDVDVIVNSANPMLKCGGGVCGAIFKKAGRFKLWWACRKFNRPIELGSAVITLSFRLKSKFIIHTASKKYIDGSQNEIEILKKCYENSLKLATENNCKSIAFPLIGGGIYGYPKKSAVDTAVFAILGYIEDNTTNKNTAQNDLSVFLILDKQYYELWEQMFWLV